MADRGGRSQPSTAVKAQNRNGRVARALAPAIFLASTFSANQARDIQTERREAAASSNFSSGEGLTDESSLEEQKASPFKLSQRSYTASGDKAAHEERLRQAEMETVASQFVGAPTIPSNAPTEDIGTEANTRIARRPRTQETLSQQPSPEVIQTNEALQLANIQNQAAQQFRAESEQRSAFMQEAQARYTQAKRKQLQNLWRFINGADAVTGVEDVIGLVLVVVMMNLQMFNRFSFQNYDLIPEPEVTEMAITTFIDFMLITVGLMVFMGLLMVFAVPMILALGGAGFWAGMIHAVRSVVQ